MKFQTSGLKNFGIRDGKRIISGPNSGYKLKIVFKDIYVDSGCTETRLVPVSTPLCPLYGAQTEEQIEEYFDARFDELIAAFSTTSLDLARKKRRGLSDNHYHLIKLNEKLKAEIPTLLFPYFKPHDYSIYDENVEFVVNAHPKYVHGNTIRIVQTEYIRIVQALYYRGPLIVIYEP